MYCKIQPRLIFVATLCELGEESLMPFSSSNSSDWGYNNVSDRRGTCWMNMCCWILFLK